MPLPLPNLGLVWAAQGDNPLLHKSFGSFYPLTVATGERLKQCASKRVPLAKLGKGALIVEDADAYAKDRCNGTASLHNARRRRRVYWSYSVDSRSRHSAIRGGRLSIFVVQTLRRPDVLTLWLKVKPSRKVLSWWLGGVVCGQTVRSETD